MPELITIEALDRTKVLLELFFTLNFDLLRFEFDFDSDLSLFLVLDSDLLLFLVLKANPEVILISFLRSPLLII